MTQNRRMLTVDGETYKLASPKRRHAFVVHVRGGASVAFIQDPDERGRWIKTHPAVLLADCHCGAKRGSPCNGQYRRKTSSVHVDRVTQAKKAKTLFVADRAERVNL